MRWPRRQRNHEFRNACKYGGVELWNHVVTGSWRRGCAESQRIEVAQGGRRGAGVWKCRGAGTQRHGGVETCKCSHAEALKPGSAKAQRCKSLYS